MEQHEFNNEYYDAVIQHLEGKIQSFKEMRHQAHLNGTRLYPAVRLKYLNQRIDNLVKEIRTVDDPGYKLFLAEQIYYCNKWKKKMMRSLQYQYNKKLENDNNLVTYDSCDSK